MTRNKKVDIICAVLVIVALVMIYLGYKMDAPPPALTGVGFLLIVAGFQALK